MLLEFAALMLAGIHFGTPLLYYLYLKSRYLNKPQDIKVDESYEPKVTIIVPTYKEAKFILNRLDNIYAQNYSRNLIEVIVVDSASGDETIDFVREWASKHSISLRLVEEPERRGMVHALNFVLQHCQINGEIVVFTDVDAVWSSDALTKITKYFADPNVGAVTASITPTTSVSDFLEGAYREYYNLLRVAESKVHSTPIHNGALVAFRASLLYEMGGLPSYTGNDDSTPASITAFMGYRAIQVNDVIVKEPVRKSQFYRKVRRAQHLLLSFLKTKQYAKKLGVYRRIKSFEKIWKVEVWLHVVNPWLLVACAILLVIGAFFGSLTATILLGIGSVFLMLKAYRTWVLQQLYLVIAAVRNLWTREIAWSK
jgi:cellulose synthase/poly-beta-1,6-N-acetylglucosamine synthase-like glycosyltransferase